MHLKHRLLTFLQPVNLILKLCAHPFAEARADVCVQWRQHPASSCLLSLSKCQPHLPQQSDGLKTGERESAGSTGSAQTRNRVDAAAAAVYQRGLSELCRCEPRLFPFCRMLVLCLPRMGRRGEALKCANLLLLWLPRVTAVTFKYNKFSPIKQRVANLSIMNSWKTSSEWSFSCR